MPPSSTSNSEQPSVVDASSSNSLVPSAARRVALSLLAIVAFVVVADVGLRVWAPFQLHNDWEHPVIGDKEQIYKAFAKKEVDALIVGSSLTMNLDAERISKSSGHRVFNGSVLGLTAPGVRAVLEEAYKPIRAPKLVIYPLSMRDIRKREQSFDKPPFLSHKMRAARPTTWQDRIEIVAERISYLFRVRRQIRHTLLRSKREQKSFPLDKYGTRKHAPHMLEGRLKNPKFLKEYYKDLAGKGDAYGNTKDAAELVKMIRNNKRDGVETVLINMTISPAAVTGEIVEHYARYLAESKALAKREKVAWYDANGDLDLSNAYFNDLFHTGARGDKKVEAYLVPIVKRHLEQGSRRSKKARKRR